MGSPLGVCANCVAPLGQGMFRSKERPETIRIKDMPTFIGIDGPAKSLQEQIEKLIRARAYVGRKKHNKARFSPGAETSRMKLL